MVAAAAPSTWAGGAAGLRPAVLPAGRPVAPARIAGGGAGAKGAAAAAAPR